MEAFEHGRTYTVYYVVEPLTALSAEPVDSAT
jgi:hypothetical protein